MTSLACRGSGPTGEFHGMVGRHPLMLALYDAIRRAAALPVTVLIEGETGVGKELVAQALHAQSGLQGPLVSVNVATLSEQLVDSELFGVVRGAFTGAVADREGLFGAAHGGTLYLDEAGDLSLATQARLLRALETGRIRPVGGTVERPARVRLVVSTQATPRSLVAKGRWRADFYYRVAGIALLVPALSQRRSDIPLLADHFLARLGSPPLDPRESSALLEYAWPGNVRELLRALERAVFGQNGQRLTARTVLDHVMDFERAPVRGEQAAGTLRDLERRRIEWVLDRATSTRAAAEELGLSPYQLYRRLRALGLRPLGRREGLAKVPTAPGEIANET